VFESRTYQTIRKNTVGTSSKMTYVQLEGVQLRTHRSAPGFKYVWKQYLQKSSNIYSWTLKMQRLLLNHEGVIKRRIKRNK
jgi:hypothetical protein